MKVIFGLGNIGSEYILTRHNVGFIFLDYLASKKHISEKFNLNKNLKSYILKIPGLILVKPTTFMNNSGLCAQKVLKHYNLTLNDLTLVHDDIDLRLGDFKISKKGGTAGHKGVESVINCLNSPNFTRVKIGIAPEFYNSSIHKAGDYVLKNFKKSELVKLEEVFDRVINFI